VEESPIALSTRILACGRTLWLELRGVLNWRTTDLFRLHIRAALACPCRRVIVDLTGLDYIGGNGLRALVMLQEELAEQDIELRLVAPAGSRCARTIILARLHGVLTTFAQPSQAWRHRDRVRKPAQDSAQVLVKATDATRYGRVGGAAHMSGTSLRALGV
jgi:anti-anti-sigma factor